MRFLTVALYSVLLLAPSAYIAWEHRDMPRFGFLHDDSILFVTAQSLAQSGEYRIASLPEQPYETKYPPLYPKYLSLAWKWEPNFPASLRLLIWMNWIFLPVWLALSFNLYRRHGFSQPMSWILIGVMALNPTLVLFSVSALTEVLFTCGLLVLFRAMEKDGARIAFAAGLIAGLLCLCRTAGAALLLSAPIYYAWKGSRRNAVLFLVGILPFLVGWTAWAHLHRITTADPELTFYTDYLGFQFLNVGWHNILPVISTNFRELLAGIGSLAIPRLSESLFLKVATALAAVAMVGGVWRLAKRGQFRHYALFGSVSVAILLVWHFPPNERFVLPLYPLLLAGLFSELDRFWQLLSTARRSKERETLLAAWLLHSALAAGVAGIVYLHFDGTFRFLPDLMNKERIRQSDRRAVYTWMAEHLPRSSRVLSAEDTMLYLYTGLRGTTALPLPRDWYQDGSRAGRDFYANIAAYCIRRNLDYLFLASDDLAVHWTQTENMDVIKRSLKASPDLSVVYQSAAGTVFHVRSGTN